MRLSISKCSVKHSKNLVSLGSLACKERIRKLVLETKKKKKWLHSQSWCFDVKINTFTNLEMNKKMAEGEKWKFGFLEFKSLHCLPMTL